MANRARQLGLDLTDDLIKAATSKIKNLADQRSVTIDQVQTARVIAVGPLLFSSTSH